MQIGLVGKPSSGKSSFFSAATMIQVPISSRPFTTIEPNKGIGLVRTECAEKFFNVKCNPRYGKCVQGTRFVPIELIDVAGLVPGAHEGKGLGNQFLDDLRKADALIHVVDASGLTNSEGKPVQAGSYDPCNDISFLEKEIDYWFKGILEKNWNKVSRSPVAGKNQLIELFGQTLSGLGIKPMQIEEALNKTNLIEKKLRDWNETEIMSFATALREKGKPILVAANKADLPESRKNIQVMKEKFPGLKIIPCSAASEIALKKAREQGLIDYLEGNASFALLKEKDLNEQQKNGLELIKKNVFEAFGGTGIQQALEVAVFELLGYFPVFPGGVHKLEDSEGRILPDCYLMPKNSTALDFAFRLHTDIGEGFIKAIDVRTKKLIGRDYQLKAGDVVEIVFKKK